MGEMKNEMKSWGWGNEEKCFRMKLRNMNIILSALKLLQFFLYS